MSLIWAAMLQSIDMHNRDSHILKDVSKDIPNPKPKPVKPVTPAVPTPLRAVSSAETFSKFELAWLL